MIHTHFHHQAFHTEHEARLCRREGAERAAEAAAAYQEMHKNKDVVAARAQFDNPDLRREYPEMTGKRPLDRSFFTALMLGSTLSTDAGRKGYATVERKDIALEDPFHLGGKTEQEIGEWLSKNVSASVLLQLDKIPKPATEPELTAWHKRIGLEYKQRMVRGGLEWEHTGSFNDTLLARVPLERYRTIRTQIDDILGKNNIIIPGIDADKRQLGDTNLSRREYLALLSLVWNEKDGEDIMGLLAVEAAQGVERVRTLITTKQPEPSEADKVYIDLSLEELGPSETLSGLGITIPVDLRRNYKEALLAKDTDEPETIETEAGPVLTGRPKMILKPEDSAAVWDTYPERAYTFLSTYMAVPGTGNIAFLDAMRYYFILSPSDQLKTDLEPVMTEKETRARLHIITQMLVDSEKVLDKTNEQTVGFRDSLTLADKVENGAGDIFKYMMDMRKHPIGSAAMWAVVAGTVYGTYKFLTGETTWRTKLLAYGALFGIGVGLYQQNRMGEAWWETAWNKASGWMGRERTKQPHEQTLPNYWAEELKMDSDKERVMLSLLGEGKVGDVMDWYRDMRVWKKNGSKMEDGQPDLNLNYDPKFDKFFGTATWEQRNEMFYTVLSKFLTNRGRAVKSAYPGYLNDMKLEDEEAVGNAYIRDRYLDQSYVVSVISGIERVGNLKIDIDGDMIMHWNDNDPRLIKIKTDHPKMYATLFRIHQTYEQERHIRASQNWDMSTIFLLEANPETLRRMGRAGVEAASLLDVVSRRTQDILQEPFKNVPEDRAGKEDLFRGDEETLMTVLGKRFLQKEDPKPQKTKEEMLLDFDAFMNQMKVPESYRAFIKKTLMSTPFEELFAVTERERFNVLVLDDWNSFLERLPVDPTGKEKLGLFLPAFLIKNDKTPQVQTLNEIERIKYQLLILAAKKDSLLDGSILEKLDPNNDATWSVLLDQTVDLVWFDQAAFPKMESLTGLKSLFNSEAPEQGGVEWYNLLQLFPRWKQTDFTALRNQIGDYQNALARLRMLPIIEPGKAPLNAKQIDEIETQLARRMANRTLEALLLTHGRGAIPDLAGERTVSPIEQGNLSEYNDEIFIKILGKRPEAINPNVKLPTTLETINNYVFNQLPNDTLQVLDQTGKVLYEYVWDPTQKFWVEKGFPWIMKRLDEADIILGQGLNAAGEAIGWSVEQLEKLWKDIAPVLYQFPGEAVKVTGEAAQATLIWLDKTGKEIGRFAYDQSAIMHKKIYALHGISETEYDAFILKEAQLEDHEHNGKNAGLKVLVRGENEIVIGQAGYAQMINPRNAPAVAQQMPDLGAYFDGGAYITLSKAEFISRSNTEIINEWVQKALVEKNKSLQSYTLSPMGVKLSTAPRMVEYDFANSMLNPRAKSSVYDFMQASDAHIAQAFASWLADPAKPVTDTDPLNRP